MKKVWKRALAYMLAVTMCFNAVNVPVYAQEDAVTEVETEAAATEEAVTEEMTEAATVSDDDTGEATNEEVNVEEETTDGTDGSEWDQVTNEKMFEGENFRVTFTLTSDWNMGYNASVKLENTGESTIHNWYLGFGYNNSITNIWNAEIFSNSGNEYVIKNAGWNQDIAVGQIIEFGISGQEDFAGFPTKYMLIGELENGDQEDYSINYQLLSDWGSGFTASINITNCSEERIEDWVLEFDFDRNIDNLWNAVMESHEGNHYVIKNAGYNANIAQGQSITFGFNGTQGTSSDIPDNFLLKSYGLYNGDSMNIDTDGDGIVDGLEKILGLNYKKADTDGDGLDDYDDVILGFSPLLQDTDGNGVLDPDEKVYQTVENNFPLNDGRGIIKVEVSMDINGNIDKKVGISNVYEMDSLSSNVVGLIGVPVEIRSNATFDTATIQFTYDEATLGDTREEDLAVLWYDEDNDWYQILDQDSIVDTQSNTVSYLTTHFSTYMLVDKTAWYEAWRENIDYRISSDGDAGIHLFDIAFVVDVSGSMGGTRINNAKTALNSFINAMQVEDEAAVISFNSSAKIVSDFTNDKVELREKVNSLTASGGTNVNNGLLKALEVFDDRETDRRRIVVLICDGDVNYYQSTIDKYIKNEIQIYAVNLLNSSSHTNLQKMADQTNGQYYYGSSVDDLAGMLGIIQDDTINKIDPTDNDGDELYDIYETAGIKLPNGQIIYTDPTLKDTDGDGLTDFEETGIVYNVDDRYIGFDTYKTVKYFIMHSDPTLKDTDGDGIGDKEDSSPWFADQVTKNLSNKYSDAKYLKVAELNGGYQNWWYDKTNLDPQNDLDQYLDYILSPDYQMGLLGCGVVAMTDMELYLTQQNNGYSAPLQEIEYDYVNGYIEKDNYMKYAEYNRDNIYYLGDVKYDLVDDLYYLGDAIYFLVDNTLHYFTGVLPMHMESGIEYYLRSNNHPYTKATWAPYCGAKSDAKNDIANKIETMISRNLPVVFSYHTSNDEKKLKLYEDLESAKEGKIESETTKSHYMTIIGYSKYLKEDGISYSYILEVVSWGKIYYIDYDEYADNLSYVTSILEIK